MATDTEQVTAYALCDTGSTHSWVDGQLRDKLGLKGDPCAIDFSSLQDQSPMEVERVQVRIQPTQPGDDGMTLQPYVKERFMLADDVIDVPHLKKRWPHLEPIQLPKFNVADVSVVLGQDAFPLMRPLEYRSVGKSEPWAVRCELAWCLSGHLPRTVRRFTGAQSCTTTTMQDDTALANQVKRWWDMEAYASQRQVDPRSVEDKRALELLERTTEYTGERYSIGLLWTADNLQLPNNYGVAKAQLLSLESAIDTAGAAGTVRAAAGTGPRPQRRSWACRS